MRCIGRYSKMIAMLSLTAVVTTGCSGVGTIFGGKGVVAEYETENYNHSYSYLNGYA